MRIKSEKANKNKLFLSDSQQEEEEHEKPFFLFDIITL